MSREDDVKRARKVWGTSVGALADLSAQVRAEALEEAADECEGNLHPDADRWDAAKAIRALRDKP
jgi:hypothetical protein